MVLSIKYVQDILVDVWRERKIKIHQKWVSGACGYTSYSLNIHCFLIFLLTVSQFFVGIVACALLRWNVHFSNFPCR